MRGGTIQSGLRLGVALSVMLHAGVAFVASTIPFSADSAAAGSRLGLPRAGEIAFDLSDPALLNPDTTPEQDRALTALLVPQPLTPPTAEELERKLVLGIDESSQKTDNWMGFADPTPHSAPLSSVNQPQLDPNPGMTGAPAIAGSSQSGPHTPLVPNAAPAETAIQPMPDEPRQPREGVKAPDSPRPVGPARTGPEDGSDAASEHPPTRGEQNATGDRRSRPAVESPDPGIDNPNRSGSPRRTRGTDIEPIDPTVSESDKPQSPREFKPGRGQSPQTEIVARPSVPALPSPGAPNTSEAATPTVPMPAGGPTLSAAPGSTGDRPGERSAKEADPASTNPTVEIRPGRPAAAQGLDITTKRPNFTRLTRVTAIPDNPLLRVTFNRVGIVSKVILVESSGVPDVDQPVINAVYQWVAKGKILADLNPADLTSGITVSVRILLR